MELFDYVRAWVHDLTPYSPGRTVEGAIKLASNENNYGPSPKVIAGLRKFTPHVFRYPYKDLPVKDALAKYAKVKSTNLVVGNGSDEIIELIVKALKGPIASHYPTFIQYHSYAKMHNIHYISSKLDPGFTFNVERFIRQTKEANIVFLCTPNNPTGTTIDPDDIVNVAKTGKIVVVDEAYYEFSAVTVKDFINKYQNIIVLRTFAKAFGLAGLRLGYGIASPKIAEALNKVKPPFNVNYLAHEASLLALSDVPYMKKTVAKIIKDRDKVAGKLSKRFKVIPSKANFILTDVSPMTSREFYDKLMEHKIVVRPQPPFKGFPGNWVRITIGTSVENKKLIETLDKI